MGLFDKLKKKTERETIFDEKKLEEVRRYQAKDYPVITDLQVKPFGKNSICIEGKTYCKLWGKEIDVDLYGDVPIEYAEKCAEAMNSMPDDLIDAICRAARKYCIEFLEDIGGAEFNEIEMTIPVDESTPAKEMLKCFEIGSLSVETPQDPSRIGYQLSGNCDWEEEHGIEIDILDGKLVYLGEYIGESPWTEHLDENWNYAAHIND